MTRHRPTDRPSRRIRPRFRPALDRLEGRALMAFAGGLDPTFGAGGIYSAQFHPGTNTGLSDVDAIAIEPDGSIVEAGTAGSLGYDAQVQETSYGVIHLTANGALDIKFGTGGEADLSLPGLATNGYSPTVLVQADGKIVVVGEAAAVIRFGAPMEDTVVARFNADGTPDTSFGTGGQVLLGPSSSTVYDKVAQQADGKLVLAGTGTAAGSSTQEIALTRLDVDGQVDTSFGIGGLVTLASTDTGAGSTAAQSVAIAPSGQIYVLGDESFGDLFRVNPDGSLDTSFNPKRLPAGYTSAGLAVQPNGQVLVLDSIPPPSGSAGATLERLNTDGTLAATIILPTVGDSTLGLEPDGDVAIGGNGPTDLTVTRLTPNLALDASFGIGGVATVPAASLGIYSLNAASTLAITPGGQVIAAGTGFASSGSVIPNTYNVVARLNATGTSAHQGDFTGDGIADPAVFLTGTATFVIGNSSGGDGQVVQFGVPGPGQTIPAPGNYYGTGREDIAAYFPLYGAYAIQDPTGQTTGIDIPFGAPGIGNTIPAPGDYFGTGADDVAVYLTQPGTWAILTPGLQSVVSFPFGQPGVGNTIPVPGDYFGTGADEPAVYLPQSGTWSIFTPGLTSVVTVPFGIPGAGNSIPAPGDYDGSGHIELAVYLPALGELQYISGAGKVVTVPFGIAGGGQVLPEPGDYDGLGKTEIGAFSPTIDEFAYRPSNGAAELAFPVGFTDQGPTIPVTTVALPPPRIVPGPIAFDAVGVPGQADPLDFLITPEAAAKRAKAGDPPTRA